MCMLSHEFSNLSFWGNDITKLIISIVRIIALGINCNKVLSNQLVAIFHPFLKSPPLQNPRPASENVK